MQTSIQKLSSSLLLHHKAQAIPLPKAVFSIAGGGAGSLLNSLLTNDNGCSSYLLESRIPYAKSAFINYVQMPITNFVSFESSDALASAGQRLGEELSADSVMSCGITAAMMSSDKRVPRGGERAFVTVFSSKIPASTSTSTSTSTSIVRGSITIPTATSRQTSDMLIGTFGLLCVLVNEIEAGAKDLEGVRDEVILRTFANKEETQIDINIDIENKFWGAEEFERCVSNPEPNCVTVGENDINNTDVIVFPGSYNPLHAGHEALAKAAQANANGHLFYELSIDNADKPPLTMAEVVKRLAPFEKKKSSVMLTKTAPLFIDKAKILSQLGAKRVTFVIGFDTFVRVVNPDYYKTDMEAELLNMYKHYGVQFVVGGRLEGKEFLGGSEQGAKLLLEANPNLLLEEMFLFLDEAEFRNDSSSTTIRNLS